MLLGQGMRKLGEPCWSHAQCFRYQPHAHCMGLVCTCDSGFHNNSGKCTKHLWEDIGLVPWEIIVFSLVFTIAAFAMFVGGVYFIISKVVRFARTRPAETLTPEEIFKEDKKDLQKQTSTENKSNPKGLKNYEMKLMEDSSVESQLVDETVIRFSDFSSFSNNQSSSNCIDSASTASFLNQTQFITPLDYRSKETAETRRSSTRSSSTQSRASQNPRGFQQHRFMRAWSTMTSHDDSDEWFQPNRSQFRMVETNSPASTTRLPLLLRASTFSESDESP